MPDAFRRYSSYQLARKSAFKMPVSLLVLAHFIKKISVFFNMTVLL